MKSNITPKSHVTPGPWSVAPNGCCIFTDALTEGRGIAMCGMAARTPEEIAANTKLIAAAPDLFAALQKLDRIVADVRQHTAEDSPLRQLYSAALAESSQAIARVTS